MCCVQLALFAATASAAIATPALRIGDHCPETDIDHWVKTPGNTDEIDPGDGNVYVLDFWATWCMPCIAGFEDISTLQEKHADENVIVIVVSDESRATVEQFLTNKTSDGRTQSERMRFVVATDPDKSTHTDILEASSEYVLPQSVIIGRDGIIEWVGHPKLDNVGDALASYLAGEWDRDAYRETFEAKLAASVSVEERMTALLDAQDWPAAEALAGDDWKLVNGIAWRLVLNPDGAIENPDLALAQRLARRASALAPQESFPLHVLAAVRAARGDLREAVSYQEQAVALEGEEGAWAGFYAGTLARYRAAFEDETGEE